MGLERQYSCMASLMSVEHMDWRLSGGLNVYRTGTNVTP